jgi:hypothetical protein
MATTLAPNIGFGVGETLQGRHFLTSNRQRCVDMALLLHTTGAEWGKREVLEEVIDRFQMQPLMAPTTARLACK